MSRAVSGPLQKTFDCQVKTVAGAERTLEVRITTGGVDRDGDTIDPAGWQLENYRKNPVVLWAHDYYGLPIARTVEIRQDARGLIARAEFTPPGSNPLADSVYALMLGGFLRAASIGMNPLKYAYNEARGGFDFIEQELLEWSVVPVPANAEALVTGAKAAGIDLQPMVTWAKKTLVVARSIELAAIAGDDEVVVECADADPDELLSPSQVEEYIERRIKEMIDEKMGDGTILIRADNEEDLLEVDDDTIVALATAAVQEEIHKQFLRLSGRLD